MTRLELIANLAKNKEGRKLSAVAREILEEVKLTGVETEVTFVPVREDMEEELFDGRKKVVSYDDEDFEDEEFGSRPMSEEMKRIFGE